MLKTEKLCRGDSCDDTPVEWRDKKSGGLFNRAEFAQHRHAEAWRLAYNWFLFGGVACLAAAWYRSRYAFASFYRDLVFFLAVDAAAALVIALQVA